MTGINIFLYCPTRKTDSELTRCIDGAILDRLDRILLNNSIEILFIGGAETITIIGTLELLDPVFRNNGYIEKIVCLSPETGVNTAIFAADALAKAAANKKAFILFSNTAGLGAKLLDDMKNILNIEEEVCAIYSTADGKLLGLGVLHYDESIAGMFSEDGAVDTLEFVKDVDRYFILREGVYGVETKADLKRLYTVLSNRENNHLCSKYFYDQLTEIFIETKELLK